MSDDHPTQSIPKVPDWAIEIIKLTKMTQADVSLVAGDLALLKADVRSIQQWKIDSAPSSVTSDRVREVVHDTTSKADLESMAQLAQEIAARKELAVKVDDLTATQATQLSILTRLDKVTSNPTVKVLAGMIATAAVTWLATHGGVR